MVNNWAKVINNHGQIEAFILDFVQSFDTPTCTSSKQIVQVSYGIGGKTLQ